MFLRCWPQHLPRALMSIQSAMLQGPNRTLGRSQTTSLGHAPAAAVLHPVPLITRVDSCHRLTLNTPVRHCASVVSASSSVTTHIMDADVPPKHLQRIQSNFCRICGSKMELIKAPTEREWRHVCTNQQCGFIDYHNPRLVVGCIVEHEGKILLCRRGIEPCKGLWTVPAGYMELAESTAQGAARETREEACAEVQIQAPFCHWDIPVIGQAYILFRAKLAAPYTHAPGSESLETHLFAPDEIPFDSIAFSSVALSLKYYLEDRKSGWRIHHGVVDKVPGSGPNDPSAFGVVNLMQLPLKQ